MMDDRAIQSLVDLGFTPMEAQVYISLLAESPMSGYSIAKKLGKPAAYVYRAIDALEKKGAVLKEVGTTRQLRATPIEEFINQLNTDYAARLSGAADNLSSINREDWDDKIYTLSTIEQLFERVSSMLDRAQTTIYLDLYPEPHRRLKQKLEAAVERGTKVRAIVYEELPSSKSYQVVASTGRRIEHWPRQWLRVAVDGSEYLHALLTEDGGDLYNGIWSANPVQAWLAFYSLGMELRLHEMSALVKTTDTLDEVKTLLDEWSSPERQTIPAGAARFEEYFGWKGATD